MVFQNIISRGLPVSGASYSLLREQDKEAELASLDDVAVDAGSPRPSSRRSCCSPPHSSPGPIGLFTNRLRERQGPLQRQGPTAYLDGLRGVAALIVYIFHWLYLWLPWLRSSYGTSPADTSFWQLSIVRILHSGRASVTVFFVISGFVLSTKALALIHQRKDDLLLHTLAGITFRRPFRLFLPIAGSTAITALFFNARMFYPSLQPDDAVVEVLQSVPQSPPGSGTLVEQYEEWFWALVHIMDQFRYSSARQDMLGHPYNGPLWTIPYEFRGSLLVMLLLLAFARARRWVNVVVVSGLIVWMTSQGESDMALFSAGMLLSEYAIVSRAPPPPSLPLLGGPTQIGGARVISPMVWKAIHHAWTIPLFFASLHCMSYPEMGGENAPGFVTLSQTVPQFYTQAIDGVQTFWLSVGAVLFAISLACSPAVSIGFRGRLPWHQAPPDDGESDDATPQPLLQRPFVSRFAQYLGRISYSIYLCHTPVIHIVGTCWLNPAVIALSQASKDAKALADEGHEAASKNLAAGTASFHTSFFWGTLVNTLALFWASDLCARLLDEPAVTFARWLATKAWAPAE